MSSAALPQGGQEQDAVLSIAILTHERRVDLERCLDSIYRQAQDGGIAIVVLVNGSDDGSAEMVRASFPDVELHLSATNLGCPAGRNRLTELCRTTWVAYLDDDGYAGDTLVADLRQAVADAPRDIVLIAGHMVDPEDDSPPTAVTGPTGTFCAGICAIRRDDFLRLGGYHTDGLRQGEETELSIKLHDDGLRAHRAAHLVLYHPRDRDPAKRRLLLRTGLRQSLLTGLKFCPWWMVPVWTGWKLLIYLRLAVSLRALGAYGRGLVDVARALPDVGRTRQPARASAVLAASGRFGSRFS